MALTSVAFSPDGGFIASASKDRTLRLWEIETGSCVQKFEGHADNVNCIAFTPDGRFLVSGSSDKTLKLWEVRTGTCVRTLEAAGYGVYSIAVSADGRFALSGSYDETLLWELETGACQPISQGNGGWVYAAAFSPDRRFAVTGGDDKILHLWALDWQLMEPLPADWDEGARPYLENFLTLHTPYLVEFPPNAEPAEEVIPRALTRQGAPVWSEDDFQHLVHSLGWAGYGWLRPEGVRRQLGAAAARRTGSIDPGKRV